MRFHYTFHLLPLVALLAACGPDKSTGDDSTSVADTTAESTGAPTSSTAGESTDTTASTGAPTCDQEPEECICAPTCGQNSCVDGSWVCECVPCGGSDPETDPVTTEPGTTTDTTDTDTTTGGLAVDCDAEPQVFPMFNMAACEVDDDCTLAFHQVDCCGSRVAWGIATVDVGAFTEAESTCGMQLPVCDCIPKPTVADDGKTAETDDEFDVVCTNKVCRSFVP